jgi:2-desacetyl-2-hydroxyethyl bacteriochlorophyllide A dehydrogenase
MKAWHFTTPHSPLQAVEIPDPQPADGEVLVRIRAAGLCHTDISFIDGDVPGMPTHTPIVLGHEVAGVVEGLGGGVTGWSVGDPVGLAPVGHFGPGVGRDGGYAQLTVATVEELVRVPAHVSFAQAASATDAGATAYHAVRTVGGVGKGDRVGIIGLGGLGQIGARVAVLAGAEVHVIDLRPQLAPLAAEIGVHAFHTDTAEFTALGLDTVLDFAGMDTTGSALAAVRPGGLVVQVGAGKPAATISVMDVVLRDVRLVGSFASVKDDVLAVYDLLDRGELDPLITTIPFDEIGVGLERLRRGEVEGRLVATTD